eukprot:SAG11_NODE_1221_length_5486_cov_7.177650_8_plen_122_part_00
MAVPLYIAEAAPPAQRGQVCSTHYLQDRFSLRSSSHAAVDVVASAQLVTLNNVAITFGQFTACVVDGFFSKVDYPHGWRYMLGLGAVSLRESIERIERIERYCDDAQHSQHYFHSIDAPRN